MANRQGPWNHDLSAGQASRVGACLALADHDRSGGASFHGQTAQQGGLPDAGLAAHEEKAAVPVAGVLQEPAQRVEEFFSLLEVHD
jgi:hypothetical protein